jgi:hypothetical protein
MSSQSQRLLQLRVLALQNVRTGYPEHQMKIRAMRTMRATKMALPSNAASINHFAWRYREQISPELWPAPKILLSNW